MKSILNKDLSEKKMIKVSWEVQKEKLKERFSNLTDKDLYFNKGEMEEMLKRLQGKVGISRHELHSIIGKE